MSPVDWLTRNWDQGHWVSAALGGGGGRWPWCWRGTRGWPWSGRRGAAVAARWAMWQIPPPGRSRAAGTPSDGWSRLGQLAVAVLMFTLVVALIDVPFR